MFLQGSAMPFLKYPLAVAAGAAVLVGAGFAFAPSAALIGSILLASFLFGMFVSPFLLFGLYYGISQTATSVRIPFVPVSLNQILFMAFLGAMASRWLTATVKIPRTWPFWAFITLAVLMTASAATGVSRELGLLTAKSIVTLSVVSASVALLATSLPKVRLVFWAFLIPTVLNGCVGMTEAVFNTGFFEMKLHFAQQYFRINGISPNSIDLAQACLFVFPMALYLARHGLERGERIAAGIVAAFLLLVVGRTFNLQNLLIVPVLVLAAAALFRGQMGRRIMVASIAAAILAGPFLIAPVSSRIERLATGEVDESMRLRQDNRANSMRVFRTYPLIGAGLGSYQDAWWPVRSMDTYYNQYEEIPRQQDVDFNYALLLAETGMLGFGIHLIFYISMIVMVWKLRRRAFTNGQIPLQDFASVLLLLWLQYIVSGFTQDNIFHMRSWLIFAMSAALAQLIAAYHPDLNGPDKKSFL
jgi:O-antigen ligase